MGGRPCHDRSTGNDNLLPSTRRLYRAGFLRAGQDKGQPRRTTTTWSESDATHLVHLPGT